LKHTRWKGPETRTASTVAVARQQGSLDAPGMFSDTSTHAPLDTHIDAQALIMFFNGRDEFVRRILGKFLENHHDTPTKLRALADERAIKDIATLAHTLKGVLGTLLLKDAKALAARTEQAAKTGSEDAYDLTLRLADAYDAIVSDLRQQLT
jgi:HPt (histidine-containing phosphotransfer) domain-containing protein